MPAAAVEPGPIAQATPGPALAVSHELEAWRLGVACSATIERGSSNAYHGVSPWSR